MRPQNRMKLKLENRLGKFYSLVFVFCITCSSQQVNKSGTIESSNLATKTEEVPQHIVGGGNSVYLMDEFSGLFSHDRCESPNNKSISMVLEIEETQYIIWIHPKRISIFNLKSNTLEKSLVLNTFIECWSISPERSRLWINFTDASFAFLSLPELQIVYQYKGPESKVEIEPVYGYPFSCGDDLISWGGDDAFSMILRDGRRRKANIYKEQKGELTEVYSSECADEAHSCLPRFVLSGKYVNVLQATRNVLYRFSDMNVIGTFNLDLTVQKWSCAGKVFFNSIESNPKVVAWNINSGKKWEKNEILGISCSPDERKIWGFSPSDNKSYVLDSEQGKILASWPQHQECPLNAVWNPHGNALAVVDCRNMLLWTEPNGISARIDIGPEEGFYPLSGALLSNSSGDYILTSDRIVRWEDLSVVTTFDAKDCNWEKVSHLEWGPLGRYAVIETHRCVRLWDNQDARFYLRRGIDSTELLPPFSHISFFGPSNHILHIAEGDVVYSYDLIEKESSIVGLRVETDGKVEVFDSCAVSKK